MPVQWWFLTSTTLNPSPSSVRGMDHILGSEWLVSVALRVKAGASLVLTVPFLTVLQLPQEMLPLLQRRNTNRSTQHPMPPKRSKWRSSHHSVSVKWRMYFELGANSSWEWNAFLHFHLISWCPLMRVPQKFPPWESFRGWLGSDLKDGIGRLATQWRVGLLAAVTFVGTGFVTYLSCDSYPEPWLACLWKKEWQEFLVQILLHTLPAHLKLIVSNI